MKRENFYENLHKKNLKAFQALAKLILKGALKIIDIRIEEPDFGHQRIVIFLHEEE